jgi:hypothetical protein
VATFSSTVIAIPFSWIVSAITAAPYFFARRHTRSRFFPPSSRCTELMRHRPGWIRSAASMHSGEVESITVGICTDRANNRTMAERSAASSRPAYAVHRSTACAPSSCCSRAIRSAPG